MADQVTPANALGRTDRSVESWEVPIGGTGGSDLPAERDGGGELPVRVQRCDNQEKLCDPFLNRFFGMINHENISCVLEDQKQMCVYTLGFQYQGVGMGGFIVSRYRAI